MDRYKRDIELRLKKAQNSVDEHVIELNKQVRAKYTGVVSLPNTC